MNELQRHATGRRDTGARTRLIEAARSCVCAHGVARTTSRLIADAAGENLAAITYYFGSKDTLVAVALATEVDAWIRPVLDRLAEGDDPAARLADAVTMLTATFEAQRQRLPGLLEAFVAAARDGDEPRQGGLHGHVGQHDGNPIRMLWRTARTELATVIAELKGAGAVPAWVQPDAMAALIMAVVAGTAVGEAVADDAVGHRAVAAQFVALLLAAGNAQGPA